MMTPRALFASIILAAIVAGPVAPPAVARDWPAIPAADAARLKARVACSCLTVQRMSLERCSDGEPAIWRYLYPTAPKLLETPQQRLVVEVAGDETIVRLMAGGKALAQSHSVGDGGGCVTDEAGGEVAAVAQRESRRQVAPQPLARGPLPGAVDRAAVEKALDQGFSPEGPLGKTASAAFVVLDDRVVVERYAAGLGAQNEFYLGSVAKVFNNLLAGLLVRDDKLRVAETVNRPEWRAADDPRRGITFDHLLHMTSGIGWEEEFFKPGAPAYSVYFAGPAGLDVAGFVAARESEAAPGTHFEYSTGASTLLARALQERLKGEPRQALLQYFGNELFAPLGITGVTLEFDRSGTYLAGHAAYARAEDLARIGLLLLKEGVWKGRRVLPEGWLEYSRKPTPIPGERSSGYGAQLMLEVANVPGCFGHHGVGGQFLAVCPKRGLVAVWLGTAFDFSDAAPQPPDGMVNALIRAFPERASR